MRTLTSADCRCSSPRAAMRKRNAGGHQDQAEQQLRPHRCAAAIASPTSPSTVPSRNHAPTQAAPPMSTRRYHGTWSCAAPWSAALRAFVCVGWQQVLAHGFGQHAANRDDRHHAVSSRARCRSHETTSVTSRMITPVIMNMPRMPRSRRDDQQAAHDRREQRHHAAGGGGQHEGVGPHETIEEAGGHDEERERHDGHGAERAAPVRRDHDGQAGHEQHREGRDQQHARSPLVAEPWLTTQGLRFPAPSRRARAPRPSRGRASAPSGRPCRTCARYRT